ncbi:hypothetical protein M8C21_029506 [Ambrosia artemisiifolia]|uniref:Uncharacterized protein n=1 Tax=Ambrosia artemisiifolia TaxID=4212 RepID=A0AAD5CZI2_AMBAR|nr:hypothetical protein M8C21_029506 [Ambrosia artemisiifolia]
MRGLQDLGVGRIASSFKKKRTRVAHVHDFLKKKNRRCQLTKVLKKTEMVSIPVVCEELTGLDGPGCSNAKVWGKEYNNELKGSTGDVANNISSRSCKQKERETSSISELIETDDSSGRLFDVPFVREEQHTAGSFLASVPETGQVGTQPLSGQCRLAETISVRPDEFQESGSISSGADISHIIDNNGSSKWQHKGKRKSRYKSKTKTMRSFLTRDDESRTIEVTGPQRLMFIHQPCSTVNPRYKALDLAYKRNDTRSFCDVKIDVESGNFPRHLPYISLLSNFTGQTVTGHSLDVEVLNESVSDLSLNSSECLSSSCELGGVTMVYKNVDRVPEASKKHRKNGLSSNKKIRKLSSLTGSKLPSEKEMLKRPDLACVPLKVVFGRINAALGISSADEGLTR